MSKKAKKKTIVTTSEKEKFNIKPWLVVFGAILLLLGIVFVAYVFEDFHYVRKFDFDYSTGELTDRKNDITYVEAPICFEPVRISQKPYAKDGDREYYMVGYLDKDGKEQLVDTSKMLATSKDQGSYIYYNPKEVTLPSLEEFGASSVFICDVNYNTRDELDSNETKILVNAVINGEKTRVEGADGVFVLRFRSTEYPHLSYCLDLYLKNEEFYIYDMSEKKATVLSPSVQRLFDKDLLSVFDR